MTKHQTDEVYFALLEHAYSVYVITGDEGIWEVRNLIKSYHNIAMRKFEDHEQEI